VARYRGGLSVLDYVKVISVQQATRSGLREIASTITTLADTEGLRAHGDSVRLRTSTAKGGKRAKRVKAGAAGMGGPESEDRGGDA
jgi:histidinol dehydrogenase